MSDDETTETEVRPFSYIEASPFYRLFSDEVNVMLIDVFLRTHYTTLSIEELERVTERDASELRPRLQTLLDVGIISEADSEESEEDGRQRYEVNKNHTVSKRLGSAQAELFSYAREID